MRPFPLFEGPGWRDLAIVALIVLLGVMGGLGADAALGSSFRGYDARPCGMDLDDDGIIGETADCNVCDATSSTTVVATDYDRGAIAATVIAFRAFLRIRK